MVDNIYSGIDLLPREYASDVVTNGCLVMEGGAFRAIYSEGVMDYLQQNGFNFSCVIGVSAGAMNGVNYQAGQIGRAARVNLRYRHDPNYVGVKPILTDSGVIGFDYIFGDLPNVDPFDYKRFNDPKWRFVAVTTDVLTGKTCYFEKGKTPDIFQAVRASASMPYVSSPVQVEDSVHLDGGCSCNIPYKWAIEQGFDKIVVIKTRDRLFRDKAISPQQRRLIDRIYKDYPDFANVLSHSDTRYNLEMDELDYLERSGRVFVFAPSVPIEIGRLEPDMEKLGNLYHLGREDAINSFDRFKSYILS